MARKIDLSKLPPLNALKGFEATLRRGGVREAADELCVTHPAVTYQIQSLEEDLGIALFSREGRGLVPTAEGRLLYDYVRQALNTLIEGAQAVRSARAHKPLRIQTYVTASIRWLAPRIPAFLAEHPHMRLLLSTCAPDWEFDEAAGDVGLVYCESSPRADFHWVPLFDYALYPVCAPSLAARLREEPSPADLAALPLVGSYSERYSWETWFESLGVRARPEPSVMVDTLALALELALSGSSVALANGPFVADDLAAGRLVVPIERRVACPGAWGLICRRELATQPAVHTFIEWFSRAVARSG